MTTWYKTGEVLPIDAESISECQYDNGRIWIIGAKKDGRLYYSIRKWVGSGVVYTEPKLVTPDEVSGNVRVFISEKDGNVVIACGKDVWYINPKDIDEIHNNPPNFNDSVLLGTSFYQFMNSSLDDFRWFVDGLVKVGGTMTEQFLFFSWQDGWRCQPVIQVGTAEDGGIVYPKYDLEIPDPFIWDKISKRWEYLARNNVTLSLRIYDYCSIKDSYCKKHLAIRSNIQRLDQNLLTGGLWPNLPENWKEDKTKIWYYYHSHNIYMVENLRNSGVKFKLIPMNEADYLMDKEEEQSLIKKGIDPARFREDKMVAFHRWFIDDLVSMGVPKEDIIISSYPKVAAETDCALEVHGVNSPEMLVGDWANRVPNGDGPDQYAKGRAGDKPNKREPSVEQGLEMGKFMRQKNIKIYGYFNRATEQGAPNIRNAQFDVLEAIVKGYNS